MGWVVEGHKGESISLFGGDVTSQKVNGFPLVSCPPTSHKGASQVISTRWRVELVGVVRKKKISVVERERESERKESSDFSELG